MEEPQFFIPVFWFAYNIEVLYFNKSAFCAERPGWVRGEKQPLQGRKQSKRCKCCDQRKTLFQCLCGQESKLCTFCLNKLSPISSTQLQQPLPKREQTVTTQAIVKGERTCTAILLIKWRQSIRYKLASKHFHFFVYSNYKYVDYLNFHSNKESYSQTQYLQSEKGHNYTAILSHKLEKIFSC